MVVMVKAFQMFQHSVFASCNLEVRNKSPVLVRSICCSQKQAPVVRTKKTFHVRNATILLLPSADMSVALRYISATSPSNCSTTFRLLAAFLLASLPLTCFCVASVKEIVVKISSTDANIRPLSSYKAFTIAKLTGRECSLDVTAYFCGMQQNTEVTA